MGCKHPLTSVQLGTLLLVSAIAGACVTLSVSRFAPTRAEAATLEAAGQKPAEEKRPGRPVVHFEIGCRNSAKTREFYGRLFDWQIQAGAASTIQTGAGRGIDGHITALGHEPEHYVTFYVEVEDIKSYLDKAAALGGKTLVPAVKIPTGHFAWLGDPDGNIVGLIQPKKP
jgi:predicted enzyme related to lactoylglutathione lyase